MPFNHAHDANYLDRLLQSAFVIGVQYNNKKYVLKIPNPWCAHNNRPANLSPRRQVMRALNAFIINNWDERKFVIAPEVWLGTRKGATEKNLVTDATCFVLEQYINPEADRMAEYSLVPTNKGLSELGHNNIANLLSAHVTCKSADIKQNENIFLVKHRAKGSYHVLLLDLEQPFALYSSSRARMLLRTIQAFIRSINADSKDSSQSILTRNLLKPFQQLEVGVLCGMPLVLNRKSDPLIHQIRERFTLIDKATELPMKRVAYYMYMNWLLRTHHPDLQEKLGFQIKDSSDDSITYTFEPKAEWSYKNVIESTEPKTD